MIEGLSSHQRGADCTNWAYDVSVPGTAPAGNAINRISLHSLFNIQIRVQTVRSVDAARTSNLHAAFERFVRRTYQVPGYLVDACILLPTIQLFDAKNSTKKAATWHAARVFNVLAE